MFAYRTFYYSKSVDGEIAFFGWSPWHDPSLLLLRDSFKWLNFKLTHYPGIGSVLI